LASVDRQGTLWVEGGIDVGVKDRLVANAARAALNLVATVAFAILALSTHDVAGYVLAGCSRSRVSLGRPGTAPAPRSRRNC